jgi:hypothetical protein
MSELHWIRDAIKLEVDGDLVLVTPYSAWTYEVTQEYFAVLDVIRARNEHLFLLVDATRGRHVPEERVRRLVATWSAKNTFSGMAIFGVSPLLQSIALLIFNAANLVRRGSAPITFVKDEAAARRWISERRVALQGGSRDA